MDERYTNSLIESTKSYVHDLRYLGRNNPSTLKALTTFKIGHMIYYWANMINETDYNKKKIEKFINCVILNNPNIILPTSDPICLYYSNVSTPQTDYTWRDLCGSSTFDSVDHTMEIYTLTVISSGATQVSIKVSEPDNNEKVDGVTTFTRSYNKGVTVKLTAPSSSTISGLPFQRWVINGIAQAINETEVTIVMDKDTIATATYVPVSVSYTLTVGSSNPNSGVYITLDKLDINNLSSGSTSFERNYTYNEAVTLTAPGQVGNAYFKRWSINGVAQADGLKEVSIFMTSPKFATAIYEDDSLLGTLVFNKIVTNDYLDPLDNTEFTFTATYGDTVLTGSFSQNHPTTFYNVPVGDYEIVESPSTRHTLVGIVKDPPVFDANNLTQTISIINKQIPESGALGSLTINKTVIQSGLPVDDPTVFNISIHKGATLIANGKVSQDRAFHIDNLSLGEYTISETLIEGYTPSYDVNPVTIDLDNLEVTVEITNTRGSEVPVTGNINITKVMLNGGPDDDAQLFDIVLTTPSGTENYTVSKNVPVNLTDMPFGAYSISETVPDGYKLITIAPSNFSLSTSNVTQNVTITNSTCGEEIECSFDPYFDYHESSSVSVLSVGNLVSDTVTFDEYVIDWYRDGSHAMVSGYGSDPDIESYHPFTGSGAVPVLAGTWVPVIRYVVIGGVKIYNSPTGTGRDCEDWCTNLSDLPVIIVVSPLTCSSTNSPVTPGYNYRLSYTSTQDFHLASRTVQFLLPSDLSARYFAYYFLGYDVADKVQIYLNGEDLLADWTIGSRYTADSYWSIPGSIYASGQSFVVEIPTYEDGDYLLITITPSVLESNPRTNWTLDMKCMDDSYVFNCDLDLEEFDQTITSLTLTNNTSACRWELTANIPNFNQNYTVPGEPMYNFFKWSGLSLRGSGQSLNNPTTKTFGLYFNYGSSLTSVATSAPGASTFISAYGNINISKVGNVFTVVCADSRDYDAYVYGYNYLAATPWYSGYNPDNTTAEYYRFFMFLQRYKEGGCGDGFTYDNFYIHRSANFTFNGTNTITITLPSISNNYAVTPACDTSYSTINGYVNLAQATYNRPDFSQTTMCRMTYPLGYGIGWSGKTVTNNSSSNGFRSFYMRGNLTSPCNTIDGFFVNSNYYERPLQSLFANITAAKDVDGNYTEDPAQNFEVYSRITDTGNFASTNQRLLYKIVGGVVSTNILPSY